jgi:hypothetical protein
METDGKFLINFVINFWEIEVMLRRWINYKTNNIFYAIEQNRTK